jgi:hypothetical protein
MTDKERMTDLNPAFKETTSLSGFIYLLIYLFVCFRDCIAQDDLELLGSSDSPASASATIPAFSLIYDIMLHNISTWKFKKYYRNISLMAIFQHDEFNMSHLFF